MKTLSVNPAGPVRDWIKTADGELLLVDELNHRIVAQTVDGQLRVAAEGFRYPRSITVMDSIAYVVDSWNHRVRAFQMPGWDRAFEFGSFFCPSWITAINNRLVVADTNNRRLSFHAPDGSLLFTFNVDGFPKRLGADKDGNIVVQYDNDQTETLSF